ncbi:uncharacterized protein LOC141588005 [Silene latifolia]|uniref:uncharacterized protein LOC141588005 n=1 Tax=Silene latifolia TaxID=37657 RepID=UPI003D76E789
MAICRNFLWDGSSDYHRVPLVAWDKVTLPKKEGGLGIKKADIWNIATVGKLVNWIYCKADRLWIKWISDVYIKEQDWHTYTPPADATWVWKNVCKVKEKLKHGYHENKWILCSKGYSIKEGYAWLTPANPSLNWTNLVWNNWNVPKHSMTTCLRMNEGMNVKSKLFRFGCCTDDWCILCHSQAETVEHLFVDCVYAVKIQTCLLHWFGGSFLTVGALSAASRNTIQWKFRVAVFNAYCYTIWFQRNHARINAWLARPEAVAARIEDDIRRRVKMKCKALVDHSELLWLQSMNLA